ncbi:MAG TPA: hypothetical protein VJY41_11440 [Prolixibacteraceae bacterium]|nr:hypothetical protein [Prolixibacteraceae bacterium]
MKALHLLTLGFVLLAVSSYANTNKPYDDTKQPLIIDHNCINISSVPLEYINGAKQKLVIAYGHTSHGSQLITGMSKLDKFMSGKGYANGTFNYSSDDKNNTLQLRDNPFDNASDLGNPDRSEWASATRKYLNDKPQVNVIMWSWCGQAGWASTSEIDLYLSLMEQLESDFPKVKFVYMTGHLDGSGEEGKLNKNNKRIREYCRTNNKILYDFADIESFDPDGKTNYMKLNANDNCDYTTPGNEDRNWAIDWQNSHTKGLDWYECSVAHSQDLVGNLKAFAAWWLFARLAGWGDEQSTGINQLSVKNLDAKAYASKNAIHFNIDPSEKIVQTILFDSQGKTIFSSKETLENNTIDMNLISSSGLVFYRIISSSNTKYTGKLMLVR